MVYLPTDAIAGCRSIMEDNVGGDGEYNDDGGDDDSVGMLVEEGGRRSESGELLSNKWAWVTTCRAASL